MLFIKLVHSQLKVWTTVQLEILAGVKLVNFIKICNCQVIYIYIYIYIYICIGELGAVCH